MWIHPDEGFLYRDCLIQIGLPSAVDLLWKETALALPNHNFTGNKHSIHRQLGRLGSKQQCKKTGTRDLWYCSAFCPNDADAAIKDWKGKSQETGNGVYKTMPSDVRTSHFAPAVVFVRRTCRLSVAIAGPVRALG